MRNRNRLHPSCDRRHALNLHQGYSLYNVGFACGFVGLFIASILNALDLMHPMAILWNDHTPCIDARRTCNEPLLHHHRLHSRKTWEVLSGFLGVQGQIGRLPSDYYESESSRTLLNIAVLGLIYCYVLGIGAPMNGRFLEDCSRSWGSADSGKREEHHPDRPGGVSTTLLLGNSPSSPSPILAALFSTTLAPLAGQFGFFIGSRRSDSCDRRRRYRLLARRAGSVQ